MKEEENFYNKLRSPIPKNLTPEEREEWEKEIEWERKEHERRKREGFYPDEDSKGVVSKIIKKFNFRTKKKNGYIGYGP